MKASRKVFAVLSVALPLMLVASMTARAEDGSSSSSSSSSKSSIMCPNVDEKIRECESRKMIYEKFWEDGCTQIKCREDWRTNSSSSSSSVACVDVQSMIDRCVNDGGTATTFEKNGCKMVKCAKSSTSTSTGGGSVNCKRTIVNKCKVYTCDDGSVDRVCGNSQDKPKTLPPAPKGPCTDIERTIVEVKAALEKNPSSLELQKKLEEVSKRFTACRLESQSSSSSSSSGTTNTACKTEVVGSCKVTRCPGGRSFRVCN